MTIYYLLIQHPSRSLFVTFLRSVHRCGETRNVWATALTSGFNHGALFGVVLHLSTDAHQTVTCIENNNKYSKHMWKARDLTSQYYTVISSHFVLFQLPFVNILGTRVRWKVCLVSEYTGETTESDLTYIKSFIVVQFGAHARTSPHSPAR